MEHVDISSAHDITHLTMIYYTWNMKIFLVHMTLQSYNDILHSVQLSLKRFCFVFHTI